jgi:hypothetical protein
MRDEIDQLDIDINQIVVKPLYFGLVTNIFLPMVMILICYYLDSHDARPENIIENIANPLFYIFCGLGVIQGTFALWWRARLFARPMIRRHETFEHDLTEGIMAASRAVFIIIAAIAGYGLIYYFLTGRFQEMLIMAVFSFVVFQVVRPRYTQIESLIKKQLAMINEGQFLKL